MVERGWPQTSNGAEDTITGRPELGKGRGRVGVSGVQVCGLAGTKNGALKATYYRPRYWHYAPQCSSDAARYRCKRQACGQGMPQLKQNATGE